MKYTELLKNIQNPTFDEIVPRSDYVGTPKEQIIRWLKLEIIKK